MKNSKHRYNVLLLALVGLLAGAALVQAGPVISVDSSEYNIGTIPEGSMDSIKHIFKIKNTGDAVLRITQVRPGCGCTVVQFDSIIPPGKEGLLRSAINIKNLHGGEFAKGITVSSNATNTPEMRVAVKGTIQTIIAANPSYVAMTVSAKGPITADIILTTAKADLAISEVNFVPSTNNPAGFESNLPIPIQFQVTKIDSGKIIAESKYKLALSVDFKNTTFRYGEFVIKTNHPKMPEVKISGMIPQSK